MPAKQKTTVYLNAADLQRIKRLAQRLGRPAAELIREAVAEYARAHAPAEAPRSLGAGHSGAGDLSERAEELLRGLGE